MNLRAIGCNVESASVELREMGPAGAWLVGGNSHTQARGPPENPSEPLHATHNIIGRCLAPANWTLVQYETEGRSAVGHKRAAARR